MPNPLFQQRKPTNPQSVLWVIFTLLLAICLWLLFDRLSPVTQDQFEVVEESGQEVQEEPTRNEEVSSGSGTADADQLERDINSLNEDLDFSESDLRDSEFGV